MSKPTVPVVEVSRGTTHDGPGMRTTVFTKGCPLACRWCQNPESIRQKQEIWYDVGKCIECLECANACNNTALEVGETGIKIHRDKCAGCGTCAEACPAKAVTLTGTTWTVDGLLREVMKDKLYYNESGGGVTVSGGEPLLYADFLAEFFYKLRANDVHTAIDTCGSVPEETVMKVISHVDAVLYDIKLLDNVKHEELTGQGNKKILANLNAVAAYIRKIHREENRKILLWIRTPLIPDDTATEDNIRKIAKFINNNILDVIERWELCAFNSACAVKYKKMQLPWPYQGAAALKQNEADRIRSSALSQGIPKEKLNVTGIVRSPLKGANNEQSKIGLCTKI